MTGYVSRRPEPFDRARDFTVVRPFTLDGRALAPGEAFDKSLLTTRRLRQLFDQRRLAMAPKLTASTSGASAADGRVYEVKHMGFGKYVVTRDGEPCTKRMTKDEAEATLAAGTGLLTALAAETP